MTVKVLIVDEDERERIVLRYIIEQANNVEIVGEAVRLMEALLLCQEIKVDLVFMDITNYKMTELETIKKFESLKEPPLINFHFLSISLEITVFHFHYEKHPSC